MVDRAVLSAIDRSDGRRCRSRRRRENPQSHALDVSDKLASMQGGTRPAAPQRRQPIAGIVYGGEVSLCCPRRAVLQSQGYHCNTHAATAHPWEWSLLALNVGSLRCSNLSGVRATPHSSRTSQERRKWPSTDLPVRPSGQGKRVRRLATRTRLFGADRCAPLPT